MWTVMMASALAAPLAQQDAALDAHRLIGKLQLGQSRMSFARIYAGVGPVVRTKMARAETLEAAHLPVGAQLFDPRRRLGPMITGELAADPNPETTFWTLTGGFGARLNLAPSGPLSPFAATAGELAWGKGHPFVGVRSSLGLELGSQSGHHMDVAVSLRSMLDVSSIITDPMGIHTLVLEAGYQF